jgi:diguanylate cyclase (GGDEF)-like protein/PAS domain S-box-containing protein
LTLPEGHYRALVEQVPAIVYEAVVGLSGDWRYVSPQVEDVLGIPPPEFTSQVWFDHVHPDDRERVLADEERALGQPPGLRHTSEYRMLRRDGQVVWISDEFVLLEERDGSRFYRGVMLDVTARHEARDAVRRSEERFRSLVQNSTDVIALLDPRGTILYISPSVERVSGFRADELVGQNGLQLLHPDDLPSATERLAEVLDAPGLVTTMEVRGRHKDGSWLWLEATGMNLLHDQSVGGIVINYRDVTTRRKLEEELSHQAFHDPLTGLANRALFRDRLEHALAHRQRSSQPLAVMLMDLDDFKTVNDSLGHEVGDKVLCAVAQRLVQSTRPSDTAARLGGDEFAILVDELMDADEAAAVAERLVDVLREPFEIHGRKLSLRASVGIALATEAEGVDQLLRNADVAMYRAKGHGRGGYALYEADMHAAVVERLELRHDLERALEEEEFVLHYQPIVVLAGRLVIGCEALVRWRHPTRGMIPPAAFIPVAEDTGFIMPLGRWVLNEACRQTREWQVRYPTEPALSVAVNLSARQFQQEGLTDEVAGALRESGLAPRDLTLEITESLLMEDTHATMSRLEELKDLGIRLAVDDFGTGYSSLAYLQRFPLDRLKLDKRFVDSIGRGEEGEVLAKAVVNLSASLGLKTVAEGIEMREQVNQLVELGCEFGQGYYFWRALDAAQMEALLQGGRPDVRARTAPRGRSPYP